MALRNGPDSMGLITRLLHWTMAAGILGMIGLGLFIVNMEPKLANIWLYGLHKSIGLCLLALVLLRIIWHQISPPPGPIGGVAGWQMGAARAAHLLLYALMIGLPLIGWFGSAATGIDVVFFDRITLPRIAPVSETLSKQTLWLHGIMGKALIGVIALHVAGALWRQWGHRDGTLTRMVKGRSPSDQP